ncbi:hypothetical protein INQ41_01510 [Lysobacter ciconiae]|uniref:Uncharacterized protein n=1 Tax=Novilysobacter ciconiae TaxID=2781022 RepID=A0A7S6UGB6_9GAMM|nr:hypothetical protein [Lysobacter ciconiae]QOW19780.1 hypothetical protein INQ41_01510 [Lysobacter ciconiae]
MRALFIGGTIDSSEVDLDGQPPAQYPENAGGDTQRYRLFETGRRDGEVAYAIYAAIGMDNAEVERVTAERAYARRFSADETVRQ